ncbi:hypothetical protein VTO73DRAFT_2048 [Trametes versicolor]
MPYTRSARAHPAFAITFKNSGQLVSRDARTEKTFEVVNYGLMSIRRAARREIAVADPSGAPHARNHLRGSGLLAGQRSGVPLQRVSIWRPYYLLSYAYISAPRTYQAPGEWVRGTPSAGCQCTYSRIAMTADSYDTRETSRVSWPPAHVGG